MIDGATTDLKLCAREADWTARKWMLLWRGGLVDDAMDVAQLAWALSNLSPILTFCVAVAAEEIAIAMAEQPQLLCLCCTPA